jgi:hypothetical protein
MNKNWFNLTINIIITSKKAIIYFIYSYLLIRINIIDYIYVIDVASRSVLLKNQPIKTNNSTSYIDRITLSVIFRYKVIHSA